MRKCHERFVARSDLAQRSPLKVLDLGAADVNGSYRSLFEGPQVDYLGADIEAGPGVSLVMQNPYAIPLADGSVDVVLSGQMLEHCEFFWLSFTEMMRVLKPDGLLFLIAPSTGFIHRYPVDCYRFYPDAYAALAKYAGCALLDVWREERGPWGDLVGVFAWQHGRRAQYADDPPPPPLTGAAALEAMAVLHRRLQPALYLEIAAGSESLALARAAAVAVHPQPDLAPVGDRVTLVERDSDDAFGFGARTDLPAPLDLALTPLRNLDQTLRDLMYIERAARRGACAAVWGAWANEGGGLWRLYDCLQSTQPDWAVTPVDTGGAGLLLILGLDPQSTRLLSGYNDVVTNWTGPQPPRPDPLARPGPVALAGLEKILATYQSTEGPNARARARRFKKALPGLLSRGEVA